MQRLWLTATTLGLFIQPELTPLVFAAYVRQGRRFSRVPAIWDGARDVADSLMEVLGASGERAVFMARIGAGRTPRARSLRRPLEQLMHCPTR